MYKAGLWEQARMLPHLGGSVSQMEHEGFAGGGGGGDKAGEAGRLASQGAGKKLAEMVILEADMFEHILWSGTVQSFVVA